jgi:chemotaxis protein MotB
MARPGDNARPILKRRKTIVAAGHHGGAWKVAYADFVTAMMAFFLLMWLLNATTEEQRKGIADFFSPTLPVARISAGGDSVFHGRSYRADPMMTEEGVGGLAPPRTEGTRTAEGEADAAESDPAADRSADAAAFAAIQSRLEGDSGESEVEDELLRHVSVRVTDEGLVVELFDRDGPPLFAAGSAAPSPLLARLLGLVGELAGLIENPIAVEAHTDAFPLADPARTNWDLSTDRAQAAQRLLAAAGLPGDRFRRVTGKAEREPARAADPFAPENRRIAVIFLRQDLEGRP